MRCINHLKEGGMLEGKSVTFFLKCHSAELVIRGIEIWFLHFPLATRRTSFRHLLGSLKCSGMA